uniref:Uncharacterized protein n=1 Tax=Chenopodium quinoa TaxID=63459 RepID=A0A803MPA1_CHEQI
MGKDRSFLPDTVTEDFVDDVKDKVEELRMTYPKMSEQELEDEAFQQTMCRDEIPNRPVGYGLGVKKGDIFGVCGVLRKEGWEWLHRNVEKGVLLRMSALMWASWRCRNLTMLDNELPDVVMLAAGYCKLGQDYEDYASKFFKPVG